MKKSLLFRILLICSLSFAGTSAIAMVNVGLSFGNWLSNNGYLSCMQGDNVNGWQIDPYCTPVLNVTSFDFTGTGVDDLTGIDAFGNLTSLTYRNAYGNLTLPALPSSLVTLDIENVLPMACPPCQPR